MVLPMSDERFLRRRVNLTDEGATRMAVGVQDSSG